jgi:hypothetical protein
LLTITLATSASSTISVIVPFLDATLQVTEKLIIEARSKVIGFSASRVDPCPRHDGNAREWLATRTTALAI